ncbi:MAG TPA: hypothetical protein PLO24_06705, partial [Bacteroidales bacterium]|nr:hypothetical protein [Bacteroidales bacterium]
RICCLPCYTDLYFRPRNDSEDAQGFSSEKAGQELTAGLAPEHREYDRKILRLYERAARIIRFSV